MTRKEKQVAQREKIAERVLNEIRTRGSTSAALAEAQS